METQTAKIKRILKRLIKESPTASQKTVAAQVGITTSYLSQLLDDKRGGGMDLLARVADAAGTSLSELDLMANGLPDDPTITRVKHIEVIGRFMDHERALRLNRKLLTAEKAGIIESIEEYIDFKLSKLSAGRMAPAKKAQG